MDVAPNALKPKEAEALLAGSPFAGALARGDALVIATENPAKAAFATPAGLAMFEAANLAALDAAVMEAQSPGARRFRQLAQSLKVGAAPRLERLRFYAGRRPISVGLLCARVAAPNGASFLVAAAPESAAGDAPRSAGGLQAWAPQSDPAAAGVADRPLEGPVRFLWTLDAEGRFGPTDPALVARVGPNAPLPRESVAELGARLTFDPADGFAQAIAARRTFSALRLDWPEPGGVRARVALLSGAPQFDRERNFAGFRGFGIFTGESAASRVAADAEPAPSAAPAVDTTDIEPIEPSQPPIPSVAESTASPVAEPVPLVAAPPEEASTVSSTPPKGGREGGAEIFVLRPTPPAPTGALNVVPIRPGASTALTPPPSAPPQSTPATEGSEAEAVELSSQERDAFREIARALGARTRPPRTDKGGTESSEPAAEPIVRADDSGEAAPPNADSDGARRDAAALLDVLPIGALVLRGGEPVYLNRTLLDLVGFANVDELRAANGLNIIFRGRDPATLAPAGEGGGIPMLAAEGELIAVDALARSISWGGAPATLIALRRSRHEEHQSRLRALEDEAQLASARARDFAAALDLAADGMVRLDAVGRILSMNSRAETLFGYDQKEVAGENFTLLLAASGYAEAIARFEAVVRAPAEGSNELEVDARDSGGVSIPVRLVFGRLAATLEPEYCAVVRNLSKSKAAQRELQSAREQAERASALKTDFLARVSHEIRTPLQAVLGFAEVMMEERFGPIGNDRYKDYVKDIHASGQHVMSLANDLLDLAKIEAGKMEFAFASVDANRIIRECVALMQPQAARERIIMRLSLFDKLPNVVADERSLRQIMLNLMSNAVKFNDPGGQVIVSTALDEFGHPIIRVRDTGVGMDESELSVALEPFQKVPGGRRDDGTGLGLPLTKALVEANHADFSIKSRKEHGTLVEVAFPSVRAAQ